MERVTSQQTPPRFSQKEMMDLGERLLSSRSIEHKPTFVCL